MPVMDGKEAAKKIRKYEKDHQLQESIILFVTGNCSASEELECMRGDGEIRGQGFLKKPVSYADLKTFVQGSI